MTSDPQSPHFRPGIAQGTSELHASRTVQKEAAFLLPHVRHLQPGMSLLDCGSGPGTITIGLAEAVAPGTVVGIDIDAQRIDEARRLAAERGIFNVRFDHGDIHELPFEDESFDAVYAHAVLMHLRDPIRAVREVWRVLKPGGVFGARDLAAGGFLFWEASPILAEFWELWWAWQAHRGIDNRIGMRLRSVLREGGFEQVEGSASYDCYGTPEATRFFAAAFVRGLNNPALGEFAAQSNLADRERLERMREAWKRWGEQPDSLHAAAYGEAVGWKTTR